MGTIHIGALNPGRSEVKDDFGKQNKPILFTNVENLKGRKQNRPKMFTDTGLGVTTLPIFTETRYTCPVNTRDRAGKGGGGGMAGARATLGIVRGGTGTDVSESERS